MSKNIVIDSTYDEVNIAILNEHNGVTDNEKPIVCDEAKAYAFHDIAVTGTVTVIDTVFRYLKIGTEKFPFSDIYSIEILDLP